MNIFGSFKKITSYSNSKINENPVEKIIDAFDDKKKFAYLITIAFFVVFFIVAFHFHPYWAEGDGLFYFQSGEEVLNGNGKNIFLADAPVNGPVFYVLVNNIFNDAFITLKTLALLSGTGIILISYFIIRNFFNYKIALVGQLFIAFNPRFQQLNYFAVNELVALFLIFTSIYFITKKNLTLPNIILAAILIGLATNFRYQGIIIAIALSVFLLVKNRKLKTNLRDFSIFLFTFLLVLSPLLIYNFTTYGQFSDSDPHLFSLWNNNIQTPEWTAKMQQMVMSGDTTPVMLVDFNLFLENYFYNLFYNNFDKLFNFDTFNTISLFTVIPFLGIIPFVIGWVYVLKPKINKKTLLLLGCSSIITTISISFFGDFNVHFFAIILVPLIIIFFQNFRKIETNFLFLWILAFIFLIIISIVHVNVAYHLFPMMLLITILNSIFFVETLPKIFSKIQKKTTSITQSKYSKTILFLVIAILFLNAGSAFFYHVLILYPHEYVGIYDEITTMIFERDSYVPLGYEQKLVGDILSREPGIQDKYLMANGNTASYYANSLYLPTNFGEGRSGDSIESFVTRENWTDYEIFMSNLQSYPQDISHTLNPIPDYLLYNKFWRLVGPEYTDGQYYDLLVLFEPNNEKIPDNFELMWQSNKTGSVLYKIHHIDPSE
jgi:hypothetical protein